MSVDLSVARNACFQEFVSFIEHKKTALVERGFCKLMKGLRLISEFDVRSSFFAAALYNFE